MFNFSPFLYYLCYINFAFFKSNYSLQKFSKIKKRKYINPHNYRMLRSIAYSDLSLLRVSQKIPDLQINENELH